MASNNTTNKVDNGSSSLTMIHSSQKITTIKKDQQHSNITMTVATTYHCTSSNNIKPVHLQPLQQQSNRGYRHRQLPNLPLWPHSRSISHIIWQPLPCQSHMLFNVPRVYSIISQPAKQPGFAVKMRTQGVKISRVITTPWLFCLSLQHAWQKKKYHPLFHRRWNKWLLIQKQRHKCTINSFAMFRFLCWFILTIIMV
jgi:hypothetical protein